MVRYNRVVRLGSPIVSIILDAREQTLPEVGLHCQSAVRWKTRAVIASCGISRFALGVIDSGLSPVHLF